MYRISDKRSAIKTVQRYLSVAESGRWDDQTRTAVKAFFASNGLSEKNRVNYEVFELMRKKYNEREMRLRASDGSVSRFPYSVGDFGDDVFLINRYLGSALERYTHEHVLPRGKIYNSSTKAAVIRLREIFAMPESEELDEVLYERVKREIFSR